MSSLDSDITSRQEPQIHLYAEHLHNIRTLSIQASLATKSNKETKATLSADGSRLTLKHEGQDASIQLPITNLGSENEATLTIPAAPTRELNIRLNIEEKPGSGLLSDRTISEENIIPWMSSDLSHETEVCCASCEAVLIKRGAIKQWKDLPSEGWAEMMDFWHCHKPDVPLDRHSTDAPERGISANSKLVVEQGVGLVGPMDLLFAQDHCTSLEIRSDYSPAAPRNGLLCPQCQVYIGLYDPSTRGYRLHKPCLSVSSKLSIPTIAFSREEWLACHLLATAENQGVRKLSVWAAGEQPGSVASALQVWLFAFDLTVSSSTANTEEPMRVVKILHRERSELLDVGKLNGAALAEGELELPVAELSNLRSLLEMSVSLLPEKGRDFQGWTVGLLRRFTANDISPDS